MAATTEFERAKEVYAVARRDNAPAVAERLTRNVLVIQGTIEPWASQLAAAARRRAEGFRCGPDDVDESGGLAED